MLAWSMPVFPRHKCRSLQSGILAKGNSSHNWPEHSRLGHAFTILYLRIRRYHLIDCRNAAVILRINIADQAHFGYFCFGIRDRLPISEAMDHWIFFHHFSPRMVHCFDRLRKLVFSSGTFFARWQRHPQLFSHECHFWSGLRPCTDPTTLLRYKGLYF